jgi:hypothetical protein
MSTYNEQIKEYVVRYQREHGEAGLIDTHKVAAWAYSQGLHKLNTRTIVDIIASDIAQAFREEYRTDTQGRRYRAKHAVKEKVGGKSMALWADIDDINAPRDHFVKSFAQRRQQVVGDCVQLKIDVDVYNGKNSMMEQIQIVLDFTQDVEELLQMYEAEPA